MSRNNTFSVIVFSVILCLFLIGCSADDLQKTGESMGNIGKAGMGTAGDALVDDATETVDTFVVKSEFCFKYYDPLYVVDEGKEKAQPILFKTETDDSYDGAKALRELCASVVSAIGKAAETSSSDKALLDALAKPYPETGVTYGRPVSHRFGDALEGSLTGSGIVSMMAMLATMDGIELPAGLIENITNYYVPIPIQAYDTLPILDKALSLASFILQLVQYNKAHPQPEPSPEGGSVDMNLIVAIPDSIAAHTGDRTYQTVGDKISIALVLDVFDAADTIFKNYANTHKDQSDNVDYSEFGFKWIMANCGALLDRVVADINTIGYINGTHIDAAGIIGSYVSGL